jgi:hypothetical protein
VQSVIIYGNCQAEAIVAVLQRNPMLSQLFRFVYVRSFVHPSDAPAELPPEDLADCVLIAEQHDPRPFPYRDRLPADVAAVTFPSVDCNLLWPFNTPNLYDAPEPPEFPFGRFPYGDRIIAGCIQKGMSASEILEYYMDGWDDYKLDMARLRQLEMARMQARDAHCTVKMSEYVFDNIPKRRLYWTSNHPAPVLLTELTVRLVRACFNENAQIEAQADIQGTIAAFFGPRGPLGVIGVPIHPRVAEFLELEWYDPKERLPYYGDRTMTYRQYFQNLIVASLRRKHALATASLTA